MKKAWLLFWVVLSTVSCLSNEYNPVYPDDIVFEGYGTLRYQATIFDGYNIDDIEMEGDHIWAITQSINNGGIFHHYNKVTLNHFKHVFEGAIFSPLETLGDLFIVGLNKDYFLEEETTGDSILISEYNLGLIDRYTDAVQVKEVPLEDNFYLSIINDAIYLKYPYLEDGVRSFISSDLGENWTEVFSEPVERYWRDNTPYTDDQDRIYDFTSAGVDSNRLQDDALTVSIDGGDTWTTGALGNNFARDLWVEGDTVYVACARSCIYLLFIGICDDGGGLHVMEWDLE